MQIFFVWPARQYVNSHDRCRSAHGPNRLILFVKSEEATETRDGEERRRMAFPSVGLSPDFEVIANITGWDWWKMWSWDWHQLHAAEKATRKTQKNDGRKALSRRISDADIGSMGKFDSFGHSFGQNQHRYILHSHCIFNG